MFKKFCFSLIIYIFALVCFSDVHNEKWSNLKNQFDSIQSFSFEEIPDGELFKKRCSETAISPFFAAIYKGNFDFVDRCFKVDPDAGKRIFTNLYCLDVAILADDLQMLKHLVEKHECSLDYGDGINNSLAIKIICVTDISKNIIEYLLIEKRIPLIFEDDTYTFNSLNAALWYDRKKIFDIIIKDKALLKKHGKSALDQTLLLGKFK